MTDVEIRDDWAIGLDQFLNFLAVLGSPRSPLIWIAGGLLGFYVLKDVLCRFDIYCPEYEDDVAVMGCKEAKEALRACNIAGGKKDQLLGQRGTRIVGLERKREKLELRLKECLEDRIKV